MVQPPPVGFLQNLQLAGATLLAGLPVDAVAFSLMNQAGHRGVVYASSAAAARMEDTGFTLGQGPSIDAFTAQTPVRAEDFEGGDVALWPMFAREAVAERFQAVYAIPLQGTRMIVDGPRAVAGVMSLYCRGPLRLTAAHMALIEAASAPIADALLEHVARNLAADQGRPSIDTFVRAEVYQASGMVMVQAQITIDEAMARLRAYAFGSGRSINDVARDVVAQVLRFGP